MAGIAAAAPANLQKSFYGAPCRPVATSKHRMLQWSPARVLCGLEGEDDVRANTATTIRNLFCGACAALAITSAAPAFGKAAPRLPPLSNDPRRCERAFDGNTIGQANGVADKVLDLRFCDYTNDKTNLKGKTLSSALMSEAKFDNADLSEVVMTKAYAAKASFKGASFQNAVVDRVDFQDADMRGVQFVNTVLSGSTFEGANLEDANFEDALIGYVDVQKLCRNDTLATTARQELGCK